jgi:hypothetical protein
MAVQQLFPDGAQFMSDRVMTGQSRADWFRLLSAEHAQRAKRVPNVQASSMLLDMSQSWLRLAELQDRWTAKAASVNT